MAATERSDLHASRPKVLSAQRNTSAPVRSVPSWRDYPDEFKYAYLLNSPRWWLMILLLSSAYFIAGRIGVMMAIPPGLATPLWPPSGIALAALLLGGGNLWPGIFIGSLALNLGILPDHGLISVITVAAIAAGSSLQALVATIFIRRFSATPCPFHNVREVFIFGSVSFVACTIAASIAAVALFKAGFITSHEAMENWTTWWLGDLVGIIIVTPLFLTPSLTFPRRIDAMRVLESAALFISLGITAYLIFCYPSDISGYPTAYACIIFLLWAAFRLDHFSVAIANLMLSAISIWGTVIHSAPLQETSTLTINQTLLLLQSYLGVVSAMSLSVVSAIYERRLMENNRELLSRELSHRVKNTLMIIQSIASQTGKSCTNINEFINSFQGRINTLGEIHTLLTHFDWEGTQLSSLAQMMISPYRFKDNTNIGLEGPEVKLTPKQAISVSMIFHELATNAVKYGALSRSAGRVELVWKLENKNDVDFVEIIWRESGGPKVQTPSRQGFGTTLVKQSAQYELKGEASLEFHADGIVYKLRFPLNKPSNSIGV